MKISGNVEKNTLDNIVIVCTETKDYYFQCVENIVRFMKVKSLYCTPKTNIMLYTDIV